MMNNKKNRGPNFTANEKETLIHLVSKHKSIIENKKTDAVTTASKNVGWKKLTEEFNSSSSFCNRTSEQLKTCWDNIKRCTRKDKAIMKRETFLTGGGRPNQPPTGPLQGQVEDILGPTLDGLQNKFDSDAIYSQDIEISEVESIECSIIEAPGPSTSHDTFISEVEPIECSIIEAPGPSTSHDTFISEKENYDWSSWSPAALKTKVSEKLATTKKESTISKSRVQRRRPKSSLQDELLENKLELVEIAKKNLESETKIKLEILQEQLKQEKLKSEILQLKIDTLKK